MNTQNDLTTKVSTIFRSLPEGLGVQNLDATSDSLSLRVGSPDLSQFDELLERRIPQLYANNPGGLSQIEASSFVADKDRNIYLLQLHFSFSKGSKKVSL